MDTAEAPTNRVRRLREAMGLSQAAMSKELGISPQRVSQMEKGETITPTMSKLLSHLEAIAYSQDAPHGVSSR